MRAARSPPPRAGSSLVPNAGRRASLRDRHPPSVSPKTIPRLPPFLFLLSPARPHAPRLPCLSPRRRGAVSGRPSLGRLPRPGPRLLPGRGDRPSPRQLLPRSARPGQARGPCQRPALFISQVPPRARRSRAPRRRPARHPRPPPHARPRGPLPAPACRPGRRGAAPPRAESGPRAPAPYLRAGPARGAPGGARHLPAAARPRSPAGSSGPHRTAPLSAPGP